MSITAIEYPPPALARRGDLAAAYLIRDHLTALKNSLHAIRLAAGQDPRILDALDLADRQAKALAALAGGLIDQGRG